MIVNHKLRFAKKTPLLKKNHFTINKAKKVKYTYRTYREYISVVTVCFVYENKPVYTLEYYSRSNMPSVDIKLR